MTICHLWAVVETDSPLQVGDTIIAIIIRVINININMLININININMLININIIRVININMIININIIRVINIKMMMMIVVISDGSEAAGVSDQLCSSHFFIQMRRERELRESEK